MSAERTWSSTDAPAGTLDGRLNGDHRSAAGRFASMANRLDRLARAGRWHAPPLAEKALLALGLLALALVVPPWPGGVLVLVTALIATLAAGTPPGRWLRTAAAPFGFILLGSAAVALSVSDGLAFTGGQDAIRVLVRGSAAIACLLLLTTTTPAAELMRGARRLGLPCELAEVALSTYRFIFLLERTARTVTASQAARLGHDGWRRSVRSTGLMAAALLPRALDRARRMEVGLAARGFDGTLPTLTARRPVSPVRLAAIVALLTVIAGSSLWTM
jgi:cobalt/nickel transport system permease protein